MYEFKVKERNYRKIAGSMLLLMVVGIFFSVLLCPLIGLQVFKSQFRLRPGSPLRKMYEEIPFPMVFKIYVFNILNRHGVLLGEKPHFQELGPYIFHEYYYKYNTSDDKLTDTMEFNLRKTWIFKPELSDGLTGNEIITTLHPVITLMSLAVNVDRQSMISLVAVAIDELFDSPKDIFWTGTAMDLMFNGIPIDCTSQKPQAKVVCMVLRTGEVQAIQKIDRTHFKFSLLGGYNYTDNGRFKVLRGKQNVRNIGRVVEVDGKSKLSTWNGDECNEIRGTDGLIYRPFLKKSDQIWFFQKMVCRSFGLKFDRSKELRGIPVHKFTFDFEDIPGDKRLQCFCRTPGRCPKTGTMDLFPCIGAPVVLSLPHFYKADPTLLQAIGSGLKPKRDEHEVFVNFELFSGMPLSAAKRIQLNFELQPVEGIPVMRNMTNMIFPFIWLEEGAVVPGLYLNLLKYTLLLLQRANYSIMIGSAIGAPIAAIAFFILDILIKNGKVQVIRKDDEEYYKSATIESVLTEVKNGVIKVAESVQGKKTITHT